MAVDHREADSLTVCVAHVIGVDPLEVPGDGEVGLRQWLAGRNLGLVSVASSEGFEWPGRFLGRRRGSPTWAVFFGVPPGIVFDPAAGADVDGGAEAELEAAYVLSEYDPLRGSGWGPEGSGVVEVIALSSEAEGPMTVAPSAEAVAGCGATATSAGPGLSPIPRGAATTSPWWRPRP